MKVASIDQKQVNTEIGGFLFHTSREAHKISPICSVATGEKHNQLMMLM
jgi:hypothetical protein